MFDWDSMWQLFLDRLSWSIFIIAPLFIVAVILFIIGKKTGK